MSFRLIAHTPTIGAAPGESVVARVEIFNDGSTDAVYTVDVVGLAQGPLSGIADAPPARVPVPARSSTVTEVVVAVPRTLGIGQHAAAFEATSSRSNDRAVLTPFTVSIQSVSRVDLSPQPSTIRARRKASFHLDVTNNEALPVDVALTGEAPDVEVTFTPSAMSLQPGQRAVAKANVKGPRHWSGERTQHNILITARGRASSTSTTAAYVQRPLFAHRFRMALAALTVVALWLAAIGGAALWLSNRNDGTDAAALLVGVDTDGDGIPDAFFDADGNPVTATDTDGDGIPDAFVDADGNPITGTDTNGDGLPDTLVDADGRALRAVDTNGDGTPDTLSNGTPLPDSDQPTTAPEPRATILRGTVEIDDDPSTVAIALTPIELGAAPDPDATPIGIRAAQAPEPDGKIWSARTATLNDLTGSATRRTVAIEPDSTVPGSDGVWLFTDVLQGQSYEVSFSSPGYDTQSFVLTPRADGEPIDLDVKMKPAAGSLSGTVVGPSGALGGAEIRITDGTLEFVTTSASGSGSWSLQGVSTPGVYTVTSTLRGFATAVRQVRLSPGDTPTGITLQMAPGLGTITGLITANGAGLGAVTVTASNGETTLTTTTLTEGNIGFYSLPQLAVPADYTVQAELDGYVTNSRRVPLNGSLSGVDFSMTSTTSTLTGRVLSSGGGGIESAGLIVSTGELQFRASTSPTGVFEIDRLPPGDYTITVEHYQHESATEFTTVTAGAVPAPLEITLPLTSGPPEVGTGSLVVSVVNEDSTIVPGGIANARITLSRNRSSANFVKQDPNTSAVTFADLPIGTYTINVSAVGYNVSAPVTTSVGLTRISETIRLQKLGQASGTMVDSLDPLKTPLRNYSVDLYRLTSDDTTGSLIGTYSANSAGIWTTPDAALTTGVYRIEATPPTGYLVRNDQILDTSPEVRGRAMSFLVPRVTGVEAEALTIPPIEADPYPTITAKIYKPRLFGDTVEYDAIDDPSLGVTGTCNGQPVATGDITITDLFGNVNTLTNDLRDTFSITKEAVAALIPPVDLPGSCEFTVTADDRVDATIRLDDIVPSNGLSPSDRLAAAALVKIPTALTGTVFWFDKGTNPDERVALGGVAITTAAPVITGFQTTEAPEPVATVGTLSTTSAATTGAWTLNGQVFGTARYVFTAPNFSPGSVPVTIDETTRLVPPPYTNANVFTDPAVDGTGFGIELTPPNPGTISGRVTIQTSSTPKYGADMVRATDPLSVSQARTPRAAASTTDPGGDFTFADAIAGTWGIAFDPLPNHVREPVGSTPIPFEGQLVPGGSITGVDATYTELATVRVRLFDKTSLDPITLPAGLDITAPGTPELTGPVTDRAAAPPTGGYYTLAGIPVAKTTTAIDPAVTPVDYRLAVQLTDYDLSTARTGPNLTDSVIDARDIALPLVAGRVTDIDLYVDSFKSIVGSIEGLQTSGSPVDLPLSGPAELAVTRLGAVAGDPAPRVVPGATAGSFEVIGPPGTYELTPSHPEYQDYPTRTVVLGATANTNVGTYQLTLRTSQLSVDALTKLAGGTDVAGAVFDRYLGTVPCTAFPAPSARETIPTVGSAVIDIAPGDYCLRISNYHALDPTKEIAFPAIVAVTIPNSTKGTSPSIVYVTAPLPPLRATLTGRLVAENTNSPTPGVVELIADETPVLTSTFETDVGVNIGTVPGTTPNASNLNPDNGGRTSTSAEKSATCTDATDCFWTYTFQSVPFGSHDITAPTIPGYSLQTATLPVTIDALGPTDGPTFVYKLDRAPVEIALGPGTFPSLDPAFTTTDPDRAAVSLVSKSGVAATGYSFISIGATNTLIVNGVAPETGNWTLTFDDALHLPFTDDKVKIDLKLNNAGRRVGTLGANSAPVGDLVRLTGLATQQSTNNPSSIGALDGDAMMTLVGPQTYTLSPATTDTDSVGAKFNGTTYVFDVVPGTYDLTTTKTDYVPSTLTSLLLTPAGSMVADQHVAIRREATVTVKAKNRGLALPTDLKVDLLNVNDLSTYGPTALPSTASDPSVSFDVPAGTYRARTVDQRTGVPTYPQQSSTSNTTVGIGANPTIDITLRRITRFVVSGPATATVSIPTLTSTSEAQGTTIEFSETTTSGELTATVTATDHRTKRVVVPAQLFTTTAVTLLPNVTVSGTITGASNGPITAINAADATDTKSGSITSGSYSISGLDVNADGTDKTWNISYTEAGVGTGSTSVIVSNTSATAETKNITLTPRDINYDFTVTTPASPDPTPMAGATVTISNSTGTPIGSGVTADGTGTEAAGTERITVKENTAPARWVVSKAGYLTKSGTITSPTSSSFSVLLQPAITGTVFDSAGTPAAVVGARVAVCPASPATRCTPTRSDRITTSGTGGAYTLNSDLPTGSYKIWASFPSATPTQEGSIGLAIDTAGKATLTPTPGRITIAAI